MTRTTDDRPLALVTGASGGIGRAFALALAQRGHDLVVVARDTERLEAVATDAAERCEAQAEILTADLAEPAQLAAVEDRLRTLESPVDLLVNNAGYGTYGTFWDLPVDREEQEVRLNVIALMRLAHAAAEQLVERRSGGIINVSSIAAYQPTPTHATYGATKAFVSSFSQALHEELRPFGVRCLVLAPGYTRTEFQQRAGIDTSRAPAFLWQEAEAVVRYALADYEKGRAVCVPGALNSMTAAFSVAMPGKVTRRVAAAVVRHTE
jgi:short-subunit dehydrogenase